MSQADLQLACRNSLSLLRLNIAHTCTHWSSVVSSFFASSVSALTLFFPFFLASLSTGSCKVWNNNWNKIIAYCHYMSPVSVFSTVITETLSDLNCRELIMLTALEALMDGCHGVGCFLPEVQKCCLRHAHKKQVTRSAAQGKSSNSPQRVIV